MGLTPLTAGCRIGSYEVVQTLLQNGARVNHRHVVRITITF